MPPAVLVVVALLAAMIVAASAFPPKRPVDRGVGPEWRCSEVGAPAVGSDAVCIKEITPSPSR